MQRAARRGWAERSRRHRIPGGCALHHALHHEQHQEQRQLPDHRGRRRGPDRPPPRRRAAPGLDRDGVARDRRGSPVRARRCGTATRDAAPRRADPPTLTERPAASGRLWPPPAPDVCGSRPSWRPARARPGRVPRTGPHSSGGTKTPTTASDAARRPGRSTGCSVLNQESACPWSAPDEPAPGTARPTPCRSASPQRPAGRRQPPAPPAPRTAAAARRRPPDPTPPPPPAPTTESPPRPLLSPDPAVLVEDAPAVTVDPSC